MESQRGLEDNPGLSEISGQLDVVPNHGLNPAVEIFAVVLLTVGRSVTNNLAVRYWLGVPPIRPFWYFQFAECLRGVFLSGLVLFVVYLKKESWTELGLSRPHWVKDILIAVSVIFTTMLLWVPISVLIGRLGPYVYQRPPIPFVNPVTTGEVMAICITCFVVGFSEELLIRGYLLSRLMRFLGPVMSILLSSLVFSVWHIPLGGLVAVHMFIWGLVYGWTFTKVRRLYPLALAHAINNMMADLWV